MSRRNHRRDIRRRLGRDSRQVIRWILSVATTGRFYMYGRDMASFGDRALKGVIRNHVREYSRWHSKGLL